MHSDWQYETAQIISLIIPFPLGECAGESFPVEFDQFGDLKFNKQSYSIVGFGPEGELVPLDLKD